MNPINPATGLPMISNNTFGVDVGGNPYGTDLSNTSFSPASTSVFDTTGATSECDSYFTDTYMSSGIFGWDP